MAKHTFRTLRSPRDILHPITSGTPATGTITGNPGTYVVNGGTCSQNISFQPVTVGTTVLIINEPAGYNASTSPNWPNQITATVGP